LIDDPAIGHREQFLASYHPPLLASATLSAPTSEPLHTQQAQNTADAIGVPLYVYPDGSVTNFRKADAEPTATIEPLESWRPPGDHGLGDQSRKAHH